jgi:hypothetical protein
LLLNTINQLFYNPLPSSKQSVILTAMTRVLEKPSPLRKIRDACNGGKGITAQEAADALAKVLNEESRTGASIVNYERRGISDIRVLRGLALVYNRTLEEIESAADITSW